MKSHSESGDERSPVSRRNFIKTSTLAVGAGLTIVPWVRSFAAGTPSNMGASGPLPGVADVALNLLDGKPLGIDSGVSFGVPWPQGIVKRGASWVGTNDEYFPLPVVRATRDMLVSAGFKCELTEIKNHTHWYYDTAAETNAAAWNFLKAYSLTDDPKYEHHNFR